MPLRKVSRCHQDFIAIINKTAEQLSLHNFEHVTQFGSEDIDSFFSGIYKVQIKGYRDGHKVKHIAIIKWHPDPKLRMCFRESYQREIVFYQNIVPELLEIQRRFKIIEGLKIKFPNCIFASAGYNKETIVVLDLHEDGFRLLDRFHKMDLAHASLVVKNLAKLHALSFVLEKTDQTKFEELKKQCSKDVQYSDPNSVPMSMVSYYNDAVSIVSDPDTKEKLKTLSSYFLLVLNKCTMPDLYSVICHSDCWNNNVFFKYKRTKPVDLVFVDYQLARIASPVTDLSYFLYMTTDREFLSEHYDQVLNIYYRTLTAVLRQCNLDVEEVYPESVFQRHLEEYSVLGLIEALVSLKIITADAEEAFKMTEIKYSSTGDEFPDNESQNHALYVERVNGVVNFFFGRGYSLNAVLNKWVV